MSTDLIAFSKDLQCWNNVASSFKDIYAEANSADHFEWHVTISKFSNGVEYKFHFLIFWHYGCPQIQPKISLLYGQRCMVESPNFFGNWVLLDGNVTFFSITSVLLGLRNVVRRINTNGINVNKFNLHNCIYCHYIKKMTPKQEELNLKDDVIVNDNNVGNLSVSNSSMASLTISNCSNISLDNRLEELDTHNVDTSILNNEINKGKKNIEINLSLKVENKTNKTEPEPEPNPKINYVAEPEPKKSKVKAPSPVNKKEDVSSKPKLVIPTKPKFSGTGNGSGSSSIKSKKCELKLAPKIKKNNINNNKNNKKFIKKDPEEEKEAVRYLEVDEDGSLVWKWTKGRRPNQTISLNSSKSSRGWN